WKLTKNDGTRTPLVAKLVTGNVRRERGPRATSEADRDASVDCTTFKAALNFGALSPGDYVLDGNVDGVSSHFNFVVHTGNEPAWRDLYLRDKAARAKSYAEFRAIELQRLEANPDRLDVLMDLLDRALQAGTLEESRGYVQRAKETVKRREQSASAESRQAL